METEPKCPIGISDENEVKGSQEFRSGIMNVREIRMSPFILHTEKNENRGCIFIFAETRSHEPRPTLRKRAMNLGSARRPSSSGSIPSRRFESSLSA